MNQSAERAMSDGERPACAGKGFEHHQDTVIGMDGWRCPACGDSGPYADFTAFSQRLITLMPLLDKLQEQMLHQRAVILVPTGGATGPLGTFMGLDVIRVPGLAGPMIGLPALTWLHGPPVDAIPGA